jgi:hypothetical protein
MAAFTDHGVGEGVKAATHGAVLTLAALCAVYNVVAFVKRREQHHAINSAVYLGLMAYEAVQIHRHCT